MSNKRGQFYLIAAIIIIVIIFSIYGVSNYVKEDTKKTIVYDLKDQFSLESGKVVDFTLYNSYETDEYIRDMAITEMERAGENVDNIVFIYGNTTSLTLLNLSVVCEGGVGAGGSTVPVCGKKVESNVINADNGRVSFKLGNVTYDFDLTPGRNIFLVIQEGENVA
jgi:hypothetical protein